jgi:hypothetical protein
MNFRVGLQRMIGFPCCVCQRSMTSAGAVSRERDESQTRVRALFRSGQGGPLFPSRYDPAARASSSIFCTVFRFRPVVTLANGTLSFD